MTKTYWVVCLIHGGQPYSPVNYCRYCRAREAMGKAIKSATRMVCTNGSVC